MKDTSTAQSNNSTDTQTDGNSNWMLVLVLRILSIGVTYGMWLLLQWRENNPEDFPISVWLMALIAFIGVLFLLLGTIAPAKAVVSTWKK